MTRFCCSRCWFEFLIMFASYDDTKYTHFALIQFVAVLWCGICSIGVRCNLRSAYYILLIDTINLNYSRWCGQWLTICKAHILKSINYLYFIFMKTVQTALMVFDLMVFNAYYVMRILFPRKILWQVFSKMLPPSYHHISSPCFVVKTWKNIVHIRYALIAVTNMQSSIEIRKEII